MLSINDVTEEKQQEIEFFFKFYCESYINLLNKFRMEEEEKVKNKEFYKYYTNIIKNTSKLITELGITNPNNISVIYEYLLWNGYFSKDKKLSFNMTDRKIVLGALGADIMRGKSVCLNNADMLTKILAELNFEAYTLGCTIPSSISIGSLEYKTDIERNKDKIRFKDIIISKILSLLHLDYFGNHAVTCFKYNELYVVSDPTNLAFSNITDINKMQYIGSNIEAKIKAWMLAYLNDMTYNNFKELMMKFFILSGTPPLNLEKVKNFSEETMQMCNKNISLFNDFHDYILEDIEKTSNTLKKIKA